MDNLNCQKRSAINQRRRSANDQRKGFTLVEIMVVIAIMAMLFGIGLFMSFDFYRFYLLSSERDIAVGALEKARSRALANFFETSHGVHVDQDNYWIFRGSVYVAGASTNEKIPGNTSVQKSGITDIVFDELTGVPTPACTPECLLTLTEGARPPKTISINNEGRINW